MFPFLPGVLGQQSVPFTGGDVWRAEAHDYWIEDDAVALTSLSSAKSVHAATFPVNLKSADGFSLTADTTIADAGTTVKGLFGVAHCIGYGGASPIMMMSRDWNGGWTLRLNFDWVLDTPNYLYAPQEAMPGTIAGPVKSAANALSPGDSGVYAVYGNAASTAYWNPQSGAPTSTSGTFSTGTPVQFIIGALTANLRWRVFGTLSAPPSPEMLADLAAEYGV